MALVRLPLLCRLGKGLLLVQQQAAPASGAAARWPASSQQTALYSQATEAVRKLVQAGPAGQMPLGAGGPGAAALYPPNKRRLRVAKFLQVFLPVSGVSCLVYAFTHPDSEPLVPTRMPPELQYLAAQQSENQEVVHNWSDTHQAKPKRYFMPESESEVEAFLRAANDAGQKLRVVGSALSPNGLSLSGEGMMGMALLDKVLRVDVEKKQVTVQAGCRVQQLADALKPYGLTLQNYASIREQQVGGFIQVGAHGTGAAIPPVDEQVVALKLATPAMGTISLSQQDEPELFSLAKVGLGALGVVTQVTLQCVPRHQLVEDTFTASVADVKKNHAKWLRENKHLRYMWIPYTDTVVVVQANPISDKARTPAAAAEAFTAEQRLQPLRELYLSSPAGKGADVQGLSATQLRDHLLAVDPLNKDWVSRVNRAEADFWRRSSGQRTGYSDEILGFDCGGQQWVLETSFPVADSLAKVPASRSKDIEYMETLLAEIKKAGIPAPSPIEQRWTSGSSSAMSPAAGPPGSVHSWVGVIMYLPEEEEARQKVTQAFRRYASLVQDKLMPKYNAVWHWAKLEPQEGELAHTQKRLASRFPVKQFNAYRALLDPKNILANEWLDKVLPRGA